MENLNKQLQKCRWKKAKFVFEWVQFLKTATPQEYFDFSFGLTVRGISMTKLEQVKKFWGEEKFNVLVNYFNKRNG